MVDSFLLMRSNRATGISLGFIAPVGASLWLPLPTTQRTGRSRFIRKKILRSYMIHRLMELDCARAS